MSYKTLWSFSIIIFPSDVPKGIILFAISFLMSTGFYLVINPGAILHMSVLTKALMKIWVPGQLILDWRLQAVGFKTRHPVHHHTTVCPFRSEMQRVIDAHVTQWLYLNLYLLPSCFLFLVELTFHCVCILIAVVFRLQVDKLAEPVFRLAFSKSETSAGTQVPKKNIIRWTLSGPFASLHSEELKYT